MEKWCKTATHLKWPSQSPKSSLSCHRFVLPPFFHPFILAEHAKQCQSSRNLFWTDDLEKFNSCSRKIDSVQNTLAKVERQCTRQDDSSVREAKLVQSFVMCAISGSDLTWELQSFLQLKCLNAWFTHLRKFSLWSIDVIRLHRSIL